MFFDEPMFTIGSKKMPTSINIKTRKKLSSIHFVDKIDYIISDEDNCAVIYYSSGAVYKTGTPMSDFKKVFNI